MEEAKVNFANLHEASLEVVEQSLAILKEESDLFERSMVFQQACISYVMNTAAPIQDDGLRAAVLLAHYTFDMLYCGWDCVLRGFYSVAMHLLRNIDQASLTAIAVTLERETATCFWKSEPSTDGRARKVVQEAIQAGDSGFGEDWGKRAKHLRELLHNYSHVGRVAVSPSIVIADDSSSVSPTMGGVFIEDQCIKRGRLYSRLAFDAAINLVQALKSMLPTGGPLQQRYSELVDTVPSVTERWEKEMGFR